MADGKFYGIHLRIHPKLHQYLKSRQERETKRRQREVSMMEVTETLAAELEATIAPNEIINQGSTPQ